MSRALELLDETLNFLRSLQSKSSCDSACNESKSSHEWSGKRVRQTFIDFFCKKHNHTFVPSSSVVPTGDKSLLFTNAGMNQFKPIFLGDINDDDPLSKLKRVANSQKCIRAGGKHNDLDDVGFDTYHHTFFEMLGNWSFGDYFKKEAIDMAWELLTKVYGLNPDRLYATYFGGDKKTNLPSDDEAKQLWLQYLPPEHVLPFDMKDNFWEMGATGPCGPCTEIHYDRIGGRNAAKLVNIGDPMVIEIWNLVFIQFNREDDGSLRLLPSKHVDTGMGFERLTSVLQNVKSNYDTDIFTPILDAIQKESGARPYTGKVGEDDVDGVDMAYRVVSDHIRTLTFAIRDGAQPDSAGRNYVLRRVLRRGVRYGREKLGAKRGFFHRLVDVVADNFKDFFPELANAAKMERVKRIILDEEERFDRTFEHGKEIVKHHITELLEKHEKVFSGEKLFQLYDTFGFPYDLTELMAKEKGLKCDKEAFEKKMEETKERSSAQTQQHHVHFADNEKKYLQDQNIKETDSSSKYVWENIPVQVVAIFADKQREFVKKAGGEKGTVALILNRTPYYAESGGQVADTGYIKDASGKNVFSVKDVHEFGGYDLHIGEVVSGEIHVGETYQTELDYERRQRIAPNHTMTHVLNFALRKTLGMEANQKGSLVDEDRTRFDFSHGKAMTVEQISKTEKICNDIIKEKLALDTLVVPLTAAKTVDALRSMFDERYPPQVRVVSIGCKVKDALNDPKNPKWSEYSIELCGGTHLKNTSEAKQLLILSEESISGGVRRIVAVTGRGAELATDAANSLQEDFEEACKLPEGRELTKACSRLSSALANAKISILTKNQLEKQLDELNKRDIKYKKTLSKQFQEKAKREGKRLAEKVKSEKLPFVVEKIDVGLDSKAATEGMTEFHKLAQDTPIMWISVAELEIKNKVLVRVAVPAKSPLANKLNAKEWLSQILPLISGGGGGNATESQGQGKNCDQIKECIEIATKYARQQLA
jgi:alanyl-tRNA synthetase